LSSELAADTSRCACNQDCAFGEIADTHSYSLISNVFERNNHRMNLVLYGMKHLV
jgi:hypothetical protein